MPEVIVQLHITPDELMAYYRGEARVVRARATTGQTIQFPASALQRLVLKDGVHGRFRLEFDENHKFIRLEPVDSA